MTADPIEVNFPLRKRTIDSRQTTMPGWATDIDSHEWSWSAKAYVDVPPFGRIEVSQCPAGTAGQRRVARDLVDDGSGRTVDVQGSPDRVGTATHQPEQTLD
jgi:hypothetical protein